jgi:hypothetical protein
MWGALVTIAMFSVPGCSSTPKGEPFRPEVIAGDQAVIYVFRERGMGRAVRIVLDQHDVGELRTGEYLVRVVKPGEHFIRAEGVSSVAVDVNLLEGDAAYVQVDTWGLGGHPALTMPDERAARQRIAGSARIP